jgi:hypothetical protein
MIDLGNMLGSVRELKSHPLTMATRRDHRSGEIRPARRTRSRLLQQPVFIYPDGPIAAEAPQPKRFG